MKDAKYEKIVSVVEEKFYDPKFLSDICSKLIFCMFETNKTNNETSYRFQLDTVPAKGIGYIGLRLRWGREKNEKDEVNE